MIFDYPLIQDEGPRFENLVALDLLRAVEVWNDYGWWNFDLRYIRNKEKEEVDFLLTKNNRPFLLIETKISEEHPSSSLKDFQTALNIPALQLVKKDGVKKIFKNNKNNILVVTAHRWLSSLP